MLAGMLGSLISGLNHNAQRVNAAASNIVNVSTPGYRSVAVGEVNSSPSAKPQTVVTSLLAVEGAPEFSNVDIGAEFANLILAENAYGATLKAMSTVEEMSKTLIDTVA